MKGVLSNHEGGWGTGGSSDSLVQGNGGEVLIEQFRKNREEERRQPAERPRRRPTETDPQRRHREVETEGEMLTLLALLLGVLPCSAPDPTTSFVVPRKLKPVKEGADLSLGCLLRDPSATDLRLRSLGGGALPAGINYTADPRKGVVIHNVQANHGGQYFCSARIGGVEQRSSNFLVQVVPRHYPPPPPPSLETQEEYVRIVGEPLNITCMGSDSSHFYTLTWKHSSLKVLVSSSRLVNSSKGSGKVIFHRTVSVPAVTHNDTGTFTCVATNKGGNSTTSTHLTVVDEPYIRPLLPASTQTNVSRDEDTGDEEGGHKDAGHKRTFGGEVEVAEGKDLDLQVELEAYPPLLTQRWETPRPLNTSSLQPSFSSHNHRYRARLRVIRVRPEDRGVYVLHSGGRLLSSSVHFLLRVAYKPSAVILKQNSSFLTCSSTGYRLPTILWYLCPGNQYSCGDNDTLRVRPTPEMTLSDDGEVVHSQLPLPSTTDDVTVECVASNSEGTARDILVTHMAATGVLSQLGTPIVIGASCAAGVLLLLLVILLYKYKQKPKYEIRWKIVESSDGNQYTFIDPSQLPYNQQWEFPRSRLRLGPVLGAGAFGKVVEATAYGLGSHDNVTTVAVKMLKPSAHSEEREALMSELKILSHLGNHDNIVNLLGACTQGGPMLMITEYCSHGDLLNFLRGRAQDFLEANLSCPEAPEDKSLYKNTSISTARIRSDSGISSSDSDHYLDMQPIRSPLEPQCEDEQPDWTLEMDDLILFSYQVAEGMDFLASRNCIHRDVAARNVLLTHHRVAKICDFGLARDVMNDANYVVKGNARLPVKWMAPESIFDCVYTVQSDVWSYGILLWEIFSLGKSPYPNVVVDSRFYKMIKDGHHMSRPDFSSPEMFRIMTQCWRLEPTDRPTFRTIAELIQNLLPEHTQQAYRNIQAGRPAQWRGGEEKEEDGEEGEGMEEGKMEEQVIKSCEEDCGGPTVNQEEEEETLMKGNNYHIC
ncbi:macrophage colony-stimulating factor 1 receptor [Osmerus eperlanus]|uniref:macrophage colony-stimulating factor 1 receptor n=1 Tax=Osmerus eperlanus TaxID=29151 RepID=UPI002E157EB6